MNLKCNINAINVYYINKIMMHNYIHSYDWMLYAYFKFLFTSASGSRTSQHPVPEAIDAYRVLATYSISYLFYFSDI